MILGKKYVQCPLVQDGKIVSLDQALEDPMCVGKFLTLDELLYLEKCFVSNFSSIFPAHGKILAGRVTGREYVCSSFWWNNKAVGINETLVQGLILPGKKGYTNYLLVRKDV